MSTVSHELRFLLKHSSIYGLGNLLSKAVAFLLLPLYTRFLTPTDYGVLELIDATSALAGVVIGLGIYGAVTRFYYEIEPGGRGRLISTVYLIAFAMCAVAAVPLAAGAPWFAAHVLDGSKYTRHFLVGFGGLLAGTIVDLGMMRLRLHYQSVLFTVVSLLSMVLAIGLNVLYIVWLREGALGVLTASLIAKLIVGVPITVAVLSKTGIRFDSSMARALLKYGLPLIPSALTTLVAGYADRYFLKRFVSVAETGIFGLSLKISGSVHLLLTMPFVATFLQRRFEIAQTPDGPRTLSRVYDMFFVLLLVPATFAAVFGREVLVVMATPAYYRASDILPILLLEVLALGSRYHVELGILYAKKTQYYMYVNIFGTAVNVLLDLLLIPRFGMWGAACASLSYGLVQVVLLYYLSERYYPIPFAFPRLFKALFLSAGLVVVSRWMVAEHLATALLLKTGAFAFFVLAVGRLYGLRPAMLPDLWRRLGTVASEAGR